MIFGFEGANSSINLSALIAWESRGLAESSDQSHSTLLLGVVELRRLLEILENIESKINDGKRAAAKQLKKGLVVISLKINH